MNSCVEVFRFVNQDLPLIYKQCYPLDILEIEDNYEILIEFEDLTYFDKIETFIDNFIKIHYLFQLDNKIKYNKLNVYQISFNIHKLAIKLFHIITSNFILRNKLVKIKL